MPVTLFIVVVLPVGEKVDFTANPKKNEAVLTKMMKENFFMLLPNCLLKVRINLETLT